eukprot:1351467-Amorphochlora_amoeboformis.AAC.1
MNLIQSSTGKVLGEGRGMKGGQHGSHAAHLDELRRFKNSPSRIYRPPDFFRMDDTCDLQSSGIFLNLLQFRRKDDIKVLFSRRRLRKSSRTVITQADLRGLTWILGRKRMLRTVNRHLRRRIGIISGSGPDAGLDLMRKVSRPPPCASSKFLTSRHAMHLCVRYFSSRIASFWAQEPATRVLLQLSTHSAVVGWCSGVVVEWGGGAGGGAVVVWCCVTTQPWFETDAFLLFSDAPKIAMVNFPEIGGPHGHWDLTPVRD